MGASVKLSRGPSDLRAREPLAIFTGTIGRQQRALEFSAGHRGPLADAVPRSMVSRGSMTGTSTGTPTGTPRNRRRVVGERVTLQIARIDGQGRGQGELAGADPARPPMVVTVPDAFPGEQVVAALTWVDRRGRRAHADVVERLEPDPARIEAPCPRHPSRGGACRGCPMQTLSVARQQSLKLARVREAFGLEVDRVVEAAPDGYRWSAKRVAAGEPGALVLGSRVGHTGAGAPDVADMTGCRVDHPRIVAAADELVMRANDLGVAPFDVNTGEGALRYAWFKTDGSRVLVTLIAGRSDVDLRPLALALREADGVAGSVQDGDGNAIRGSEAEHLAGVEHIELLLAGARVDVGPLGFLQPNPAVAALAYVDLTDTDADTEGDSPTRELAFDLYAGAGITTARLQRRFVDVVPCEVFPESAHALGVPPMRTEAFLRERLEAIAEGAIRPSLVVANPPRGGMGAEVCDALRTLGSPQLRIMSCNAETLAADLDRLVVTRGGGPYRLQRVTAYDTLPHTAHLEFVARLVRGT